MFNKFLSKITNSFKNKKRRSFFLICLFLIGVFLILLGSYRIFFKQFHNKIYPSIKGLDLPLQGKTKEEAEKLLAAQARYLEKKEIILINKDQEIITNLEELGIKINYEKIAKTALLTGRNAKKNPRVFSVITNTIFGFNTPLYFNTDEKKITKFINEKLENDSTAPKPAKIFYKNKNFIVFPSKNGTGIDTYLFVNSLIEYLNNNTNNKIKLFQEKNKTSVVQENIATETAQVANKLLDSPTIIKNNEQKWEIDRETKASFMEFIAKPGNDFIKIDSNDTYYKNVLSYVYANFSGIEPRSYLEEYQIDVSIKREPVLNYLQTIAPQIEQPAINATLEYKEGKIEITGESSDQITLDLEQSIQILQKNLLNSTDIQLAIINQPALISKKNLEKLGIDSLIGKGTSNFSGSPRNRRHNITVGANKFNGILIEPNKIFSFLDLLGPVNKETGYLPELVIKNKKTVPDYGGGMCQVSSTAFRGAVNAGFEVIERKNHAYPVHYYAPQGTDATVYIPSPDLKFINNTPSFVLVQTKIEGNLLTFEYYGKNDGRKVEVDDPITYEKKPDGAMKASWTHRVYDKNGNLFLEKTFLSKYNSPNLYPHPGEEPPKEEKKRKKKKD